MNRNKTYLDVVTHQSNTFSAIDRMAALNLANLSSKFAAIATATAGFPNVKKMTLRIRCFRNNPANTSLWAVIPVIVQTDGTFTSTTDLATSEINSALDSAINDVFGFQKLQNVRVCKVINVTDDGGVGWNQEVQINMDLPRNILNLLNKQNQTERLQDIYLGLLMKNGNDAAAVVTTAGFVEYIYEEKAKSITIR